LSQTNLHPLVLDYPNPGDEVFAHYTGTLENGTKFDSSRDRNKPFNFTLGKRMVIKGWDAGFAQMRKGEKAILRCRADYAYGDSSSHGNIPPGSTLNFDVELLSFGPKKKEKFEMSEDEKVSTATALKEQGSVAFKAGDYDEADRLYAEASDYLDDGSSTQATDLWITCNINLAQVRACHEHMNPSQSLFPP
jgi:hypothetical protein